MRNTIYTFLVFIYIISAGYADTARIIDSGEDALKIRMQLIESAKEEILISYFIFAQDNTALEMLSLLRKKAREGVKVRVMIDDMFNDIPKDIGTHLQQENVMIKNFNKFNFWHFGKSIKYRMHDKMFIVDQQKIILGGRNIEDTYYDKAEKNFDDRDIYIVGSMALEASTYYNELWNAKHLSPFKQIKLKDATASGKLDEIENNFAMKKAMDAFDLKVWESDLPEVEHIDLFHDMITPKKQKMTGTARRLYDLIKNAARSVIIDSPYLIITKELHAILTEVIARGVKIRFLTNSLKSTDGLFPQAAYMSQRKKIVDMGIELYEYFGNDRFHSKSLVVDDQIAAIGSFNFDPRSQNLNTETMAVIHDPKLAALLTQSMDESLNMSYRIDENGRPTGYENKYPGVSLKKKIITKLIQFIIVPFAKGLL
jgi:putative cardiolipin synthase